MTIDQQKKLLSRAEYTLRFNGRAFLGKQVGWSQDHRGFGAVVKAPDGTRTFWVLDQQTMKINYVGTPPAQSKPVWVAVFR